MVTVAGARTDDEGVQAYFKAVVFAYRKLTQTPLLAFVETASGVEVRILTKPVDVLDLPDATKIAGQWSGEWRSDFFAFTAGEVKRFAAEHPEAVRFKNEWGIV